MSMIDNYIQAVGDELPSKNRGDIQAEIRSLIEDTLADRSKAAKKPVDEDMTVEVLKEFGSPEKVAASYRQHDYLLGPRFYRTFLLVLRIILPIMAIFSLSTLTLSTLESGFTWGTFGLDLLKAFGNFIQMSFMGLGWALLIMVILERVLPEKVEQKEEAFDPRKLQKVETPEKEFKPWELIVDLIFTIAFIVLFNVYPEKVGLYYINNLAEPGVHFLPVLTEAFFKYLPFFTMLWGLKVGLDVYLLSQRAWNNGARWAQIGLSALNIAVLFALVGGAPIFMVSRDALLVAGFPQDFPAFLLDMGYDGLRALFVLLIVLEFVHIFQMGRKLISRSSMPTIKL